jgi:hypothetical protein
MYYLTLGGLFTESRNAYNILVAKPDDLKYLGVHGRIILKWFLKKCGERVLTVFIWLRIGTSGGLLSTPK